MNSQEITGVKMHDRTRVKAGPRRAPRRMAAADKAPITDAGSAAPPPARRPGASLHGPRVRRGGVGDETTGDGVALPGVPTAVPRRGRRTVGLVLPE